MKAAFDFNPNACDYGVATIAVRSLLTEWAGIDWFVPPAQPDAKAIGLFEEHQVKAKLALPRAVPRAIDVRVERGGWASFASLCTEVRAPKRTFDWKYGSLKQLTRHHSQAQDWNASRDLSLRAGVGEMPRPGDLFLRLNQETAVWTLSSGALDLHGVGPDDGEVAAWYRGYAWMDLLSAVEWQLAARAHDLSRNPFVPLVSCYRAGFYPFGIDEDEFVLFRFDA
jgi:hypothetical protein